MSNNQVIAEIEDYAGFGINKKKIASKTFIEMKSDRSNLGVFFDLIRKIQKDYRKKNSNFNQKNIEKGNLSFPISLDSILN